MSKVVVVAVEISSVFSEIQRIVTMGNIIIGIETPTEGVMHITHTKQF